jgi:hypothetical protein
MYEPVDSVRKLERQAKLQKRDLKLSYLLIAHPEADEGQTPKGLRLIGGLMNAPDKQRRYACGDSGMVVLESKGRRLPAALCKMSRGDLYARSLPGVAVVAVDENARPRPPKQRPKPSNKR